MQAFLFKRKESLHDSKNHSLRIDQYFHFDINNILNKYKQNVGKSCNVKDEH